MLIKKSLKFGYNILSLEGKKIRLSILIVNVAVLDIEEYSKTHKKIYKMYYGSGSSREVLI
jgi:hypothetical protein